MLSNPSEAIATGAVGALEKAAEADPNPGSVTQSSTTNEGVTTDSVAVTAEYGTTPRFSVTNGDKWSIGMDEGNPVALTGLDAPWKGAEVGKKLSDGTLYVRAYTDIEEPMAAPTSRMLMEGDRMTGFPVIGPGRVGEGTLNGDPGTFRCPVDGCYLRTSGVSDGVTTIRETNITFTPTTPPEGGETTPDTDYLAGGVWLYVPDTASSADDYEFGAFADGNDPFTQSNIMALTSTATYEGDATGIYSERGASSTTTLGNFDGDVRLTADFGAADSLGTISGSITDIELTNFKGESTSGSLTSGSLTLGEAAIGSANSGFFKGAVTGSHDSRTYAGKWGGQFFGNGAASTDHPGSVAGTFGGTSTDDDVNFVGAFGAFKR